MKGNQSKYSDIGHAYTVGDVQCGLWGLPMTAPSCSNPCRSRFGDFSKRILFILKILPHTCTNTFKITQVQGFFKVFEGLDSGP